MSEKKLPKLTKTQSTATFSNQDDPARKFTIIGNFAFDGSGAVKNIDQGVVVDKEGETLSQFRKPMGNNGVTFEFCTSDTSKMQEVIVEVSDFVAAAMAEEGGEA